MRFTLSIISACLLVLAFQNCAPSHAPIANEAKEKTLNEKSLFATSDTAPDDGADKKVRFTFACPGQSEKPGVKTDLLHSGELKVIVQEFKYDTQQTVILCEVHGVKKQILDTRSVDLSVCPAVPSSTSANLALYLVEESVMDHFADQRLNFETAPQAVDAYVVAYTNMQNLKGDVACDEVGDPLMIQLPGAEDDDLELTAPSEGVAFNLLGDRAYPVAHSKEKTSWFQRVPSNTYFLVKPNKEGLVLGIDEMFADTSRGPDAKGAKHGFAALEKYDDNKDQVIDSEDVIFKELRLWKDINLDGIAQENEIFSFVSRGIVAIDLKYDARFQEVDSFGNVSRYTSIVVLENGRYGLVFDVGLRVIHQRAPVSEEPIPPSEPAPADSDPQTPESHEEPVLAPADSGATSAENPE
jgi:hypothetical protein